jgi:hypothetical protein
VIAQPGLQESQQVLPYIGMGRNMGGDDPV